MSEAIVGSIVAAPSEWGTSGEMILTWYMEHRGLVTEDQSLWNVNRLTAIGELKDFFAKFPECAPTPEGLTGDVAAAE